MIETRPEDRVLLLAIADTSLARELASRLERGSLVGLGTGEQVAGARRALRDFDNVMFVAAPPEDIPWQDSFFSAALDPVAAWSDPARVARELFRVLTPGASAYVPPAAAPALENAGFRRSGGAPEGLVRLDR